MEWKAFRIKDIFTIENCKCNKVSALTYGKTEYVGATNINNGVMNFVENKKDLITQGNCIIFICDGEGSIGYSIYKKENFIGTTTIKVGRNEMLNKHIGMFITTISDKIRGKYNFGYKRSLHRLENDKILLPIDSNGNPHWQFMEEYIKEKERKLAKIIVKYYRQKMENMLGGGVQQSSLESVEWKEFRIGEICDIKSGLRLTKNNQQDGSIPFIGASDSDNGVTGFISNINDSMDKNLLGVNYNGNVVHSFYHPYTCIFSDDVKRLHLKKKNLENKETYLFIKQIILQQQEKYAYGYKFNTSRMKRQIILLPVDDAGSPNWAYMESYIKNIEAKQIRKILRYLTYTYV